MDTFVKGLHTFSPKAGITVIVHERKGSGVVDVFAGLKGGMWDKAASNPALPYLFSEVLEEGTETMNRDDIRGIIENVGSDLSFDLLGEYTVGKLRSTTQGFEKSFRVFADILTKPTFPEESVVITKKRLMNECREEEEDTKKRASALLADHLFEKGSAHRTLSPQEQLEYLKEIDRPLLVDYAAEALLHPLIISIVGDVSASTVEKMCTEAFKDRPSVSESDFLLPTKAKEGETAQAFLTIPGKENVDVFFGNYTGVRVTDEEYVPLSVAIEMLGGSGFTGHLMQTVRERDGLTYGIYSRLKDVSGELPLYVFVWATFGNTLFEKGVTAMKNEMQAWLETGITEAALEKKKTEIIGSYVVSLEDPERVSFKLLATIGSKRSLDFLRTYPEAVSRLSLAEVKEVAQKYLNPDHFKLAAAGSIDKNGNPL